MVLVRRQMNRNPGTNRRLTCCLILSAVLVLGIVQWSFLPILIQCAPLPVRELLEVSGGHTSKFAAPFKCLIGDSLKICLLQSRVSVPTIASTFSDRSEEPIPNLKTLFFSFLPLRA